jgi:hypothetical protein
MKPSPNKSSALTLPARLVPNNSGKEGKPVKGVFLFIMLLVTTSSASGQGQAGEKVKIPFSIRLAADTLRALEGIEVCIKNNPSRRRSCILNKGLEKTLLCVIRKRCDIPPPPNGILQIEPRAFEQWKEHLTSHPGEFMDDSLRYDLCEGLRPAIPDNNGVLSEKEEKERKERKESVCLGRRRAQ